MSGTSLGAWFTRLRYSRQFALVSLLFLLPLAVTMYFMVDEQNVRIDFAEKEIAGTRYLRELNGLHEAVVTHRLLALRALAAHAEADAEVARAETAITARLEVLNALDDRYGAELRSSALLGRISAGWATLQPTALTTNVSAGYARYAALITDIRSLISTVGDNSNLILDPDLDSYYVMDAVLLRLPESRDQLARTILINEGLVPAPHLMADQRTELVMLNSLLGANATALRRNLETAYSHSDTGDLRAAIDLSLALYIGTIQATQTEIQTIANDQRRGAGQASLSQAAQVALAANDTFYQVISPILERLLQTRIDQLVQRQSLTVLFALLLVTAASLVGVRLMHSISRPLDELLAATSRLSSGEMGARVKVSGESEVAVVGRAFNAMAQDLEISRDFLEQRVAERTRDLQMATREAQDARVAAEEATRAKSAFLANMSHELRTPLNAIIGYSEMLQEEAADFGYAEMAPDLEKIRTAGKHLLALINDILDISKIEAGRMELHIERFEIGQLVGEVAATIRPMVEKNGNTLVVQIHAGGPIYADLTKLRQSLLNLLSNAAKFTERGQITLEVDSQLIDAVEHVRMCVSDTGIGMPPEQIHRLFREFSQGDPSTTRKYGGTGLGLALSRRFCQMMGGDITVSSQIGAGSTFTIIVPRRVQSTVTPEEWVAAGPPPLIVGPQRGTVLVIDDDRNTHDLLRRTLEREGVRVVVAPTGEDGLALARDLRPNLITLDVLLGGMDGWRVLAALKDDPDLAQIPVLMLTIVDERNTGYALGAADYLMKPIDRHRLIDLVNRYVAAKSDAPILVVEDDPATREMIARTVQHAGWPVATAENGRVALDLVAAGRPALILLDLMMPEVDGFTFLEELRAQPDCVQIPVIVVTAMDLSVEDHTRLDSFVQRVLQKGAYERELLLHEVRALVRSYLPPEVRSERSDV